jgi:hypothetical protein
LKRQHCAKGFIVDTPSKICIVCGEDCSGRPRTRDAQRRYTCRVCYETLQAARARAATADAVPFDSEESPPDAFSTGGPAAAPCPFCTNLLPPGSEVCIICGYNRRTGQRLSTRALHASGERAPPVSPAMDALSTPAGIGLGLFALYAAAFALALANPGSGSLIFMSVVGLGSFGTGIYRIIAAIQDKHLGYGICGILVYVTGCLGLVLYIVMLCYTFATNTRARLKAATLAEIASFPLIAIIFVLHLDHMESIFK